MRSSVIGLLLVGAGLVGCANRQAVAPTPTAPGSLQAAPADPSDALAPPVAAARPENPDGRWVSAATSSDFMIAGSSEQAFGVFIDVPPGAAAGHVPTSLTLAVDTSGSMRGEKIAHAREAAGRLVRELEDGDRLSIVTFADRGRVRMQPIEIDSSTRRTAMAVLEELSADGGTAMFEGLKVAESVMWSTPDTHLVRRLVVISDGKATEGPTSPEELGRVAEVGLQKGIQITSMGVGLDYDESTLNALAIRSSGRLYHVEHSEQLPGIVEREVALLESTVAADVKVELVAAPGVQLLGTDTAQVQWTTDGLIVPVGAVFEGQQRELLVRARVTDAREGTKVLASVRLHFRDPSEDGLARVQEAVLRATVTDDPSLVAAHSQSRTQTLIAMREASMFTQQASLQASAGDLNRADRELAAAEERLTRQAAVTHNKTDKDRVLRSAKSIAKKRKKLSAVKAAPAPVRAKESRSLSLDLNDEAMDGMGY